ncbi:MAG: helix-turn-helix domain-containing protein [Stigonema ocellatum SAG 48.90 = DSM 106950]|nr:helix-turn-helix domain-containing protein [Stigonema ocellatum SAG 48.90 = DSM 106950]
MTMKSVYFLSIPGKNSCIEISQDELRSLLGEIETKLHHSKGYRRALATLQNLLEPSSEQANVLLKAVGREAISVAFGQFLQKPQQVVENNQQSDNKTETPTSEQADYTDLSQCLTSVKVNQKSPPATTSKVDLLSEANTADISVKLQKSSPTKRTSMKWIKKLNKKSKLAEQAKLIAAEQRLQTLRQIGQQLRQAREFQGLSLSELNVYTHVQIPYMEAVETGNWELLPEEVFVRGYIRVMGNALGLNGTALAASLPAPEPMKSVLPSYYKPKNISGLGLGLNPVYLYVGYTALVAGAVGSLSVIAQQANTDKLIHSEAVSPSSLQDKKQTTKPGLQSSSAGVTVGRDISPPEAL